MGLPELPDLKVLKEISAKLDLMNENLENANKSLEYLCRCEDLKHETIKTGINEIRKEREKFQKAFEMLKMPKLPDTKK
jgi:hypothetical protein